jgi:adenine-specific DNA-methyltransferase
MPLRGWYLHSERIIFAEPACEGNLHRSPFADFLRRTREQAGITAHQLAEFTGAYGRINHGGAISNWETGRNIPSREQYRKICDALIATGRVNAMPPYEDVIRRFSVDATKEFTDIWFRTSGPTAGLMGEHVTADAGRASCGRLRYND